MKKILIIAVAVCMIVVLVVGCSSPAASSAPASSAPASQAAATSAAPASSAPASAAASSKLIGISLPSADHGWVAAVAYYADKTAKSLGLNYKLVQGADPNTQASQLDDLIALKPAAIILFPNNDQLTQAAQKVLDAKIPLFNFDRKVNVDSTCYLAGDNPGLGTKGADFIGTKLSGKGNVVIMGVPAYGNISTERIDAFKKELAAKYPDMKVLNEYGAKSSSKEDGLKTMTDVLTANKQIDAVYSIDDEMSEGILQAVQEAKRADVKVITGGGGAQGWFNLIKSNTDINLCSVLYSPMMISDLVTIAGDYVNSGKTPEKKIIEEAKVVDSSNVDKYIDASSPY